MSRRRRINRLVRDGRYRQSEDGVIEAASDGTFTVRSWDRDHAWEQLGATWIDADNQVGETARIAFVQGNPLLPVFFSRGSKPGSRFVPESRVVPELWNSRGSDFSQDNYRSIDLVLGDEVELVSSVYPFVVREGDIVAISENNKLIGDIEFDHGLQLFEMIILDKIYLFTNTGMNAISLGPLKDWVYQSVGFGESSIESLYPADYDNAEHPGRECDPDGGGIIIGGF